MVSKVLFYFKPIPGKMIQFDEHICQSKCVWKKEGPRPVENVWRYLRLISLRCDSSFTAVSVSRSSIKKNVSKPIRVWIWGRWMMSRIFLNLILKQPVKVGKQPNKLDFGCENSKQLAEMNGQGRYCRAVGCSTICGRTCASRGYIPTLGF